MLKKLVLPIDADASFVADSWDVQVSSNGDTTLLTHRKDDLLQYEILDPDTLESRTTWHESASPGMWIFSISSHSVLREDENATVYFGHGENIGQGQLRVPKVDSNGIAG